MAASTFILDLLWQDGLAYLEWARAGDASLLSSELTQTEGQRRGGHGTGPENSASCLVGKKIHGWPRASLPEDAEPSMQRHERSLNGPAGPGDAATSDDWKAARGQ